eukprot:6213202-Pleurochrysis_carterae.AAC.5
MRTSRRRARRNGYAEKVPICGIQAGGRRGIRFEERGGSKRRQAEEQVALESHITRRLSAALGLFPAFVSNLRLSLARHKVTRLLLTFSSSASAPALAGRISTQATLRLSFDRAEC